MASETPEVVVAPVVVENGGASKGKEEQQSLESELSKKLEITEDAKEENDEEQEEGSKGEYFILIPSVLIDQTSFELMRL